MDNLLLYFSEILVSTLVGFILVVGCLLVWYRATENKRQQQIQAREEKQKKVDAPFHENLIRLATRRTPAPPQECTHSEKHRHQG